MKKDKPVNDPLEAFTVPEVAKLLHTTPRTIRDLIRAGELVSTPIGCRRRVLRKDLDLFLDGRRTSVFRRLRGNALVSADPDASTPRSPDPTRYILPNEDADIPF